MVSDQPWYAPPTLMTTEFPVNARAARTAAITASVPDPSERYISTCGMYRWIDSASLSSYSWKRPVTGPDSRITSATRSFTGP